MSLFKAREWWSCKVNSGQGSEEFDHGCLCIGNIDGNDANINQIIIGSHAGYLRIYAPSHKNTSDDDIDGQDDTDCEPAADNLWIEYYCKAPILQVAVGRFVAGINKNHIAVLLPRRLAVYSLSGAVGSASHGSQWTLKEAYEHQLSRSAYNLCYGPFGQVSGDFICVQSVDATLSVFEHENFAFSRFMPESLLPGPIVYLESPDIFVTVSSTRQLEAYRYQVLAVATDSRSKEESNNLKSGKRVTAEWIFNIGETAVDMKAATLSNSTYVIVVLGRKHIFGVTDSGKLQFTRRLDFTPVALSIYGGVVSESSEIRYLIATSGGQLLVYKGTHLLWAARMTRPIADLNVGKFHGLQGAIATLDEYGQLDCLYLGTDPSLNILPPASEFRELDYDDQDAQLRKIQQRIKQASGAAPSIMPAARNENDLKIQVQLPQGLDVSTRAAEIQLADGVIPPSYTVTFVLRPKAPMNNVQVHVESQPPFNVNQKHFSFSYVDSNQPTECSVSFHVASQMIAFDFQVKIVATYLTLNNAPRIAQTSFKLPLSLGILPCLPIKQATFKLTIDTNQPPANLNVIFSDLLCDNGDPQGCALGFQSMGNGSIVTVLASKTSQRYRLQSDSLAALGPLVRELSSRLAQHFGSSFQCTFNDPLPLADYFTVLDSHWETRVGLQETQKVLTERATQFRAIQRRLLTRFKDKTPQPLANLDTLLEGSLRQLIQLAEMTELAKQKLQATACELAAVNRLLVLLIHFTKPLPNEELAVLTNVLSGSLSDFMDAGIEEVLDAGLTHMLRSVLSKTSKDISMASTPLQLPEDTTRLKKHIQMLCEKIGRGVQLAPTVTNHTSPSKSKTVSTKFQPVSIIEPPIPENVNTEESGASEIGGDLTPLLTDFRSPRPKNEHKKKKKKKKSQRHPKESEVDERGFGDGPMDSARNNSKVSEDKLKLLPSLKDIGDIISFPDPLGEAPDEEDSFYN